MTRRRVKFVKKWIVNVGILWWGDSDKRMMGRCEHFLPIFAVAIGLLIPIQTLGSELTSCIARALKIAKSIDRLNDVSQVFTQLRRNESFRSFIRQQGVDPVGLSAGEQGNLIGRYHAFFFSAYSDPVRLQKLQEESLQKSLTLHGVAQLAGQAGERLARASAENIARINREHVLTRIPTADRVALERLADQVEMFFVHSTHVLKDVPIDSVVSSKRLEEYGLSGGANSEKFNKRQMQTDDNVYFRVGFRKRGSRDTRAAAYYGDTDLVLDSAYAKAVGMISHYIMSPSELLEFGETYFPEKYANLTKKHPGPELPDSLVSELRSRLHVADFAPADFEKLVRDRLVQALYRWKTQEPSVFEYARVLIETGKPPAPTEEQKQRVATRARAAGLSEEAVQAKIASMTAASSSRFESLIKDRVLAAIGLSANWELKIPVAVPAQRLQFIVPKAPNGVQP